MSTPQRRSTQPPAEAMVSEADLRLSAKELRKLPKEKRAALLSVHAKAAALEYARNPRTMLDGGNEIIDY